MSGGSPAAADPAAESELSRARDSRTWIVGLVVSIVSLAAVAWWAVHQERPTLPSDSGGIAALLAAIAVYGLGTALRAERWLYLLRGAGARSARADVYRLTVVGYMGNNVLPARGGDALRIWLLAPRAATSKRSILGTLVAERVLDVLVLVAVFSIVAYGVLTDVAVPSGTRLAVAGALAAAVLGAVAVGLVVARRARRLRRLAELGRPVLAAGAALRGRGAAALLALTVAIWVLEAATYVAVAHAVDLDMSAFEALYVVALTSIFVIVPSGPGYAGTLDASVVFATKAIGATGALAVSYLLVLRFVLVVPITALGFVLLAVYYGGVSRVRGARLRMGEA